MGRDYRWKGPACQCGFRFRADAPACRSRGDKAQRRKLPAPPPALHPQGLFEVIDVQEGLIPKNRPGRSVGGHPSAADRDGAPADVHDEIEIVVAMIFVC